MTGSDLDAPGAPAEGAPHRPAGTWRTVGIAGGAVVVLLAAAVLMLGGERGGGGVPGGAEPIPDTTPPSLQDRPQPDERRPLPSVVLAGFGGGAPVDLDGYRGRPLVVNFWASWCAPCIDEMPDFQQVAGELESDVAMLGVNVRDAPEQAQRFAEDLGISYDLAVDTDQELEAAARVFGLPTTLFVDRQGIIVRHHTGPLEASQLREMIARLLGVSSEGAPS